MVYQDEKFKMCLRRKENTAEQRVHCAMCTVACMPTYIVLRLEYYWHMASWTWDGWWTGYLVDTPFRLLREEILAGCNLFCSVPSPNIKCNMYYSCLMNVVIYEHFSCAWEHIRVSALNCYSSERVDEGIQASVNTDTGYFSPNKFG